MNTCSPPCFETHGICDTKLNSCICGWEYGEDDCSKTFYQILGHSYLSYTIFSIVLVSIIFLFSGLTLQKSIQWKVHKLESPQKFSLLFLILGSFARIVYHSLTISGYRENKGDITFLTPLYGFFIVAIFCSFVLVLLLWIELWISIAKIKHINTTRTRKLFIGTSAFVFILDIISIIIGSIPRIKANIIIFGFTAIICILTFILTVVGALNGRSLAKILSTMKGKRKALVFNRVTLFTVSLSIVLIVSVILIALIAAKQALERVDIFIAYNVVARLLEFASSFIITLNYWLAILQWRFSSLQSDTSSPKAVDISTENKS